MLVADFACFAGRLVVAASFSRGANAADRGQHSALHIAQVSLASDVTAADFTTLPPMKTIGSIAYLDAAAFIAAISSANPAAATSATAAAAAIETSDFTRQRLIMPISSLDGGGQLTHLLLEAGRDAQVRLCFLASAPTSATASVATSCLPAFELGARARGDFDVIAAKGMAIDGGVTLLAIAARHGTIDSVFCTALMIVPSSSGGSVGSRLIVNQQMQELRLGSGRVDFIALEAIGERRALLVTSSSATANAYLWTDFTATEPVSGGDTRPSQSGVNGRFVRIRTVPIDGRASCLETTRDGLALIAVFGANADSSARNGEMRSTDVYRVELGRLVYSRSVT